MSLADDVDLDGFISSKDDLTGADIKAMCTEVKSYLNIFIWTSLYYIYF